MMELRGQREKHLVDAVASFVKLLTVDGKPKDIRKVQDLSLSFSELLGAEMIAFKHELNKKIRATERDIKTIRKSIEANTITTARHINDLVVRNNSFRRGIEEHRSVLSAAQEERAPGTYELENELIALTNDVTKHREAAVRAKSLCSAMREDIETAKTTLEMLSISHELALGGVKQALNACTPEQFNQEISTQRHDVEQRIKELRVQITETRKGNTEMKKALDNAMEFLDPNAYHGRNTQVVPIQDVIARRIKSIKQAETSKNYGYSAIPRKVIVKTMKDKLYSLVKSRDSKLSQQVEEQMRRLRQLQMTIEKMKAGSSKEPEATATPTSGSFCDEYLNGIKDNLREISFLHELFLRRQSL